MHLSSGSKSKPSKHNNFRRLLYDRLVQFGTHLVCWKGEGVRHD
jgi:hypothetical protein